MTNNEIIKALEFCADENKDCKECPCSQFCDKSTFEMIKAVYDFINRQKAEIERLKKLSDEGAECPTCHGVGKIGTTNWLTKDLSKKQIAKEKAEAVADFHRELKTEAITEFAERLKEKSYTNNYCEEVVRMKDIDQIAKEMKGE